MSLLKMMVALLSVLWFVFGCNGDGCRTSEERYRKGLAMLESGERDLAYRLLAKAAHDEPTDASYQWAAARIAPNTRLALFHVKSAWDHGMKTRETFDAYVALSASPGQPKNLQFALQLYGQLPDSLRTDDERARLYFNFQRYDSSLVIWRAVFARTPSSSVCNNIAKSYLKKGESGNASRFLLKCQPMRILNAEGYVLFNLAHAYDFDFVGSGEVFRDAKIAGHYSDTVRLAHVRSLLAQEKIIEAMETLQPLIQTAAESGLSVLHQQARIMMAYIGFARNDKKEIITLQAFLRYDVPGAVAEKELYELLARRLTDTAGIITPLAAIIKKLPDSPELNLILAREIANAGKYNEAVAIFRRLPPPYTTSPRCIVEMARLFDYMGKDMEALGMLDIMHRKNVTTKASLELLRDISFKQKNLEDAQKVQDVLKSRYSEDISVRWAGGILAMKRGNLDSALSIFTALRGKHPKEERFEYACLFVKYRKGDYNGVVRDLSGSAGAGGHGMRLLARSLARLQRFREADSVYRAALGEKKNIGIMVEYAEYLLNDNRPAEAAALYDEAIKIRSSEKIDSAGNATLLNNFAWALLRAGGSDKKLVLSTARRALNLSNDNPLILDTYAEALILYGNYPECINILEKSSVTRRNAQLLLRLAAAYEKSGDFNKAVRTLKEAETLPDSSGVDKKMVRDKISDILARVKE